jgi:phosphatidylinositol glycan class V
VWLLILSPANIFFSAVYTESMFAFFLFLAIWFLKRGNLFFSAVTFFICGTIRSNAVIFVALFVVRGRVWESLIVLLPFGLINFRSFWLFCGEADPREWCHWVIPNCYAFIQKHYWNNGFLLYFTSNNIPNFLLAVPMSILVLILFNALLSKHLFQRVLDAEYLKELWGKVQNDLRDQLDGLLVLLGFFCFFFMNVQVITRFLGVFPNLYITLAELILKERKNGTNYLQMFVLCFFVSYSGLGTILFPLFLPWT